MATDKMDENVRETVRKGYADIASGKLSDYVVSVNITAFK